MSYNESTFFICQSYTVQSWLISRNAESIKLLYKRCNIKIYTSTIILFYFPRRAPSGIRKRNPLGARQTGNGAYITVLMAAIIVVIDGTGRLHHRPLAHTPPPPAVKNSFGLPFDGLILPSIRRLNRSQKPPEGPI